MSGEGGGTMCDVGRCFSMLGDVTCHSAISHDAMQCSAMLGDVT
jgi:hypothetical protein